jgi:phosphoribosyl 1,2-cyclic phosphodiesterase
MMPGIDGLELCKRLRSDSVFDAMKIVIISGKTYEFDRKRAFNFGADGYITKPIDPQNIAAQIRRIVDDRIEMIFWGIRGTLPVPGKKAVHYGGNTSCISLEFPKGNLFIFDAGTGIKCLSDQLIADKKAYIEAKMFISHPHWDHINALPFFTPLYMQGNEFNIYGPAHGDITVRDLISSQMDGVYFPIKIKEFGATVSFHDLKEERLEIDGIQIRTILLNHPGYCLGYRVDYRDRSVCYITDNELFPEKSRFYNRAYMDKLTDFIQGSDALITDCTYNDEEYADKMCRGHSPVSEVVRLANRAGIGSLYMFHHDPDQSDKDIEAKHRKAEALLKTLDSATRCIAPREKQQFSI